MKDALAKDDPKIRAQYDVLAQTAVFEGVKVGNTPQDLLALYWAICLYDSDIQRGGRLVTSSSPR